MKRKVKDNKKRVSQAKEKVKSEIKSKIKSNPEQPKNMEQRESTDFEEVVKLCKDGWIVTEIKSEIKASVNVAGRPKTWILKKEA